MKKKTSFYKLRLFFCVLILIVAGKHLTYSQSFSSPLSSEGGVDTHIYKSDTVIFDAMILEDGKSDFNAKSFTTGLSMLHSPYLSMFYLPLKYDLTNKFQILLSLPYLTKTLVFDNTHYIKSGYGDTMIGLTKSFDRILFFTSKTTGRITLPTGNVNAQDFDYFIPMGYGGYTTSIQESISLSELNIGIIKFRMFMSGLFVYYFASSQQIDTVSKYTFDKSYSWSLLLGSDFHLSENCDVQLKVNYIDIKERKYKTGAIGWNDANDGVKQINIIPFVNYRFLDDISGRFGIIYPVKTIQDSDLTDTYDPKWKMVLLIEKRFTDSSSGRK